MKVLVVSAHYPPNFVSGGTLVPARAAAALARRGHEVRVLAGAIRTGRPPGDVFDDPAPRPGSTRDGTAHPGDARVAVPVPVRGKMVLPVSRASFRAFGSR